MITYHVGSRNETAGLTGATHFLEHLMFKGTHRFHKSTNTSIMDTLQEEGARMNATTWLDRTNYYEMLPRDKAELAFDIEADRMRNLRLDPDDIASERTVILNELDRGQNQSSRMLHQTLWSVAFVKHPYHHPTIGWRSDVQNISPEGLRGFYDDFYWPNNATLSVLGQISKDETLKLVEKYFGGIDSPTNGARSISLEPEQKEERRFQIERKEKVGSLMLGYKNCRGVDVDADALDLLSYILSANKEEAMKSIMESIKNDGVEQAELDLAKNRIKSEMVYALDGPFSVASQLNEAIAQGDWKIFPNYVDRISKITTEDIQGVARKYFSEKTLTIGYLNPID